MKRFLMFLLVAFLAITTLIGCTSDSSKKDSQVGQEASVEDEKGEEPDGKEIKEEGELIISAAASLTDVLDELIEEYKTQQPGITIKPSYGSSGALQAQIEEGAPVDIFLSAAQKQMDALEENNLLEEGTRETLLINKVVLITPKDITLEINSFEDMAKDEVKQIGIGDPGNVPVGQYSEEIFENLNLKDKIEDKLVLGSDVRTVLTWVETGNVDLGLVYATDAMTSDKVNIVTEAPEDSHKEVSYPAAVIKESKNKDMAKSFLQFLSSESSKKAFEKYGFTIK